MKKLLFQFSIFPLILLFCFTFSCQQPAEEAAEEVKVGALTDEDVAAIRASSEAYLQAWKSGDDAALAALFTEDGILMPPNESAIQARDAIRAWEDLPPPIKANLTIVEIDGRGDLAYVRGAYTDTYKPIDKPGLIQDTGKYIEILRKQQDGSWLIAILIFNSDLPLTPPSEKE